MKNKNFDSLLNETRAIKEDEKYDQHFEEGVLSDEEQSALGDFLKTTTIDTADKMYQEMFGESIKSEIWSRIMEDGSPKGQKELYNKWVKNPEGEDIQQKAKQVRREISSEEEPVD